MVRIEDRRPGRIRPDFEALKSALEELHNPQDDFSSVLIVGTNGKGSTAAMLEAVLAGHGLTTGLYTSPHLCHLAERIRLQAGRDLVDRALREIEHFSDLTYFEALTAAAFLAFRESRVDCAVLEAGLGGSWDATRLARSSIAGLTNIGTDHQKWLGHNRENIAKDKGRALLAARTAVIGPGVDDAIVPFLEAPHATRAEDIVPMRMGVRSLDLGGSESIETLVPPLIGRHQVDNLALAIALASCVLGSSFDPALVQRALTHVHWPGRLSKHQVQGRQVILEGAHNLEAAEALADYLKSCETTYNLIFSCLDDKPVEEMAATLKPVVGDIVVCALDDERAMPIKRIAAAFGDAQHAPDPMTALQLVAHPVLAAGSLRLVGAFLEHEDGAPQ